MQGIHAGIVLERDAFTHNGVHSGHQVDEPDKIAACLTCPLPTCSQHDPRCRFNTSAHRRRPPTGYVSVKRATELAGVSTATIHRAIRHGELTHRKNPAGTAIFIEQASLERAFQIRIDTAARAAQLARIDWPRVIADLHAHRMLKDIAAVTGYGVDSLCRARRGAVRPSARNAEALLDLHLDLCPEHHTPARLFRSEAPA